MAINRIVTPIDLNSNQKTVRVSSARVNTPVVDPVVLPAVGTLAVGSLVKLANRKGFSSHSIPVDAFLPKFSNESGKKVMPYYVKFVEKLSNPVNKFLKEIGVNNKEKILYNFSHIREANLKGNTCLF